MPESGDLGGLRLFRRENFSKILLREAKLAILPIDKQAQVLYVSDTILEKEGASCRPIA
jgi:hypothetical protein